MYSESLLYFSLLPFLHDIRICSGSRRARRRCLPSYFVHRLVTSFFCSCRAASMDEQPSATSGTNGEIHNGVEAPAAAANTLPSTSAAPPASQPIASTSRGQKRSREVTSLVRVLSSSLYGHGTRAEAACQTTNSLQLLPLHLQRNRHLSPRHAGSSPSSLVVSRFDHSSHHLTLWRMRRRRAELDRPTNAAGSRGSRAASSPARRPMELI